ncbi:MAG: homocitrate synthase [Candidatus Neomarinimicrobiota bacterium]
MKKDQIQLLDTTLREGEQTPGVSFSIPQKVEIAQLLDDFGIDFIELGHPAVSPDVFEAVEVLNNLDLRAQKVAHGRVLKSDVDAAVKIGVPWIGMFFGTSDISLKYKFNKTRPEALKAIEKIITYAKERGLKVRFTAEDASRTKLNFLVQVAQLAQKAGADRFSIADTVGVFTPHTITNLIRRLKTYTSVPIHVHCHNDFGLANANALSALKAGARCADVTVNGLGERSGLVSLGEAVLALLELYGVKRAWKIAKLPELSRLVVKASGIELSKNHPLLGKYAFTHKAGLHVKAMLKNSSSYESIDPEKIQRNREMIIDKYTGKAALKNRLSNLNIKLSSHDLRLTLKKIKANPQKVNWSDSDLKNLVKKL